MSRFSSTSSNGINWHALKGDFKHTARLPEIMARPHMHEESSAYYSPRARWYAPFFYLGNALRLRLAMDRLKLPREMKAGELVAGFFIPGLAFWLRGPRLWGQAALAGSVVLSLVFFALLGFSAANLALGLLISLHTTGFYYYCNPLMAG